MGSTFLIMLREGLEMALIVAIVLAYLNKVGREGDARSVWIGTLAAAAAAIGAGAVIFAVLGELHGRVEQIVEGVVSLAAAAVLTWMVFWMRREARSLKGTFHERVDVAIASGSTLALAGIAFFAILREGLETALLLIGSSIGADSSLAQAVGGFAGLALAVGLGYLVYRGSKSVNLRSFFTYTGILFLLFASGLVAKAVGEFQEAGLIGTLNEHAWNLSHIGWLNPDTSRFADFLKGLFGWNPAPSIEMVAVYLAYLVPVGFAFLSGTRGMPAAAPSAETIKTTASR